MDSRIRGVTTVPKLLATTVGAFRDLLRAEVKLLAKEAATFAQGKARSMGLLLGAAVFGLHRARVPCGRRGGGARERAPRLGRHPDRRGRSSS